MADQNQPDSGRSWLEDRLTKVEAIYRRLGRDGLKEFPMADVRLLLTSKELTFRDAPKGPTLTDTQRANNRRMELEIGDIRGFMYAESAAAGLGAMMRSASQPSQAANRDQQQSKPRDRGPDR